MSCINCLDKDKVEITRFPCACDGFVHPPQQNIGAGLNKLPRQIATFPEFRRALLKDISTEQVEMIDANNMLVKIVPLAKWRATGKGDFGVMLLEMWAYICDSLSFYDEVIANETYLRTNSLKPNLRRLLALLGYLPRPAVSSFIELAAIADGRLQIKLPSGTAFRSGAFEGNPPQVFELTEDTLIHPFINQMTIAPQHKETISENNPSSLLIKLKSEIKEDDLLLLINKADAAQNAVVTVDKIEKITGIDGKKYDRINFQYRSALHEGANLQNLKLYKPKLSAGLWTISEKKKSLADQSLTLNILTTQINPGDYILIVFGIEKRWFIVKSLREVSKSALPANNVTINGINFNLPGITTPVTELTLDAPINSRKHGVEDWDESQVTGIKVYFGMQEVASIIDEPNKFLTLTDSLKFENKIEMPLEDYDPKKFLLQDKNTLGISVSGHISYTENALSIDSSPSSDSLLTQPVDVYGNVITASRGESVKNEKMGSGNASTPNQTFKLKKKPLSYYPSATVGNDQSVKNTLTIYVNGILWKEVNSFFGRNENDQVYIVRQNDEGESVVTFGDGIRGQRVPTGIDNIVCNYRFGAEAASPPAGSVSQISKPVKGLRSVKNILPAFGGAGPEEAEEMRKYAPQSVLILGRVVSMKDMEALTASYPSVRGVQTEWRWDLNKQRATAHIFYIGDAGIQIDLSKRIRSMADPTTPITIEKASSIPILISVEIKVDPRYLEEDIIKALRTHLTNTDTGILSPENIGIGKPLFRSKIFEEILDIEGIESVQNLQLNGSNFSEPGVVPGTGRFFDIEKGELLINGE
ncbi:hypothetical protein EI546_08975 [Aequorivita sp. H23M31]|uniref:Baseplate assembly protein n=1 Tax=Aequorivita ciconiae TaxID=2494375 RepID=A0A410G3I8_9FLAO|nr:hypothetical protein [Aequorivita sp. H23M31]QAA81842.1 hypothetical protein EI546_08975 [Aequorivita sp. H23M31]